MKEDIKICPHCGAEMKLNARKCKACGEWFRKDVNKKSADTKRCPFCGEEIKIVARKCFHCGSWLNEDPALFVEEESSLPKEYRRFNWGAFFLNWIWGLGNRTYITFLAIPAFILSAFIPMLHLGVSVWFGIKGNDWAWKNKEWEDLDSFKKIQRRWALWGTIFGILFSILKWILIIALFVVVMMSDTGKKTVEEANKTQACIEYEEMKKNPDFSFDSLVRYKELKDECGSEVLDKFIDNVFDD